MVHIGNDWDALLADEWTKPYYLQLRAFLKREYAERVIYPPAGDIFNALKYSAYAETRVVILGQDPYHGEGQAHGLCFSVREVAAPPSLINILKEIEAEYNVGVRRSTDLTDWARQGVLLLNTALTVRANAANSHSGKGWETLTDKIIALLNERELPLVFMLWGNNAKSKTKLITNKSHLLLTSAHPSPLSANYGFFGNNHFIKANDFLRSNELDEVQWF
ncbi:MAG: uracil-DNA glycosylase [Clostridiales bacterium]|jgi:uracil-DNA glycosylase|nr:uracil-DNA glycosylase [Clostridiales bacterium]